MSSSLRGRVHRRYRSDPSLSNISREIDGVGSLSSACDGSGLEHAAVGTEYQQSRVSPAGRYLPAGGISPGRGSSHVRFSLSNESPPYPASLGVFAWPTDFANAANVKGPWANCSNLIEVDAAAEAPYSGKVNGKVDHVRQTVCSDVFQTGKTASSLAMSVGACMDACVAPVAPVAPVACRSDSALSAAMDASDIYVAELAAESTAVCSEQWQAPPFPTGGMPCRSHPVELSRTIFTPPAGSACGTMPSLRQPPSQHAEAVRCLMGSRQRSECSLNACGLLVQPCNAPQQASEPLSRSSGESSQGRMLLEDDEKLPCADAACTRGMPGSGTVGGVSPWVWCGTQDDIDNCVPPDEAGLFDAPYLPGEEDEVLLDRSFTAELNMRLARSHHTLDYAYSQRMHFSSLSIRSMIVWDALPFLLEVPRVLYDTDGLTPVDTARLCARWCAVEMPSCDWAPLIGLIHDLGRLLMHMRWGALPEWAVTSESYPLGCAFSDRIGGAQFLTACPDRRCRAYSSPLGIYEPACGLDHVAFTWSGAEYLSLVLAQNGIHLPAEARFVLRFQNFNAALTEDPAYQALMSPEDTAALPLLQGFVRARALARAGKVPCRIDWNAACAQCNVSINRYFEGPVVRW